MTALLFAAAAIASPCPYHCSGHGRCVDGACKCNEGYVGDACQFRAEVTTPLRPHTPGANGAPASLPSFTECGVCARFLWDRRRPAVLIAPVTAVARLNTACATRDSLDPPALVRCQTPASTIAAATARASPMACARATWASAGATARNLRLSRARSAAPVAACADRAVSASASQISSDLHARLSAV